MSDVLLCDVFRSPRKEGMYLYVETKAGMTKVPDILAKQFGEPHFVMTLALTPDKKLARVSRDDVVDAILKQGFFLQMPPGEQVEA